jgi:hypothetical protein
LPQQGFNSIFIKLLANQRIISHYLSPI